MKRRKAYTYIEIAMVLIVVAILFVAALPDEDSAAREQGDQWARRFEADVAYARSLSIVDPLDPAIIHVDIPNNRYWLARASDPATPILHPRTGEPYIVQSGPEGSEGLEHVELVATDLGGDAILKFTPLGGTDQGTSALVQIRSGGTEYELAVSPVAGETTVQSGFTKNLIADPSGFDTGGTNTNTNINTNGSPGGPTQMTGL